MTDPSLPVLWQIKASIFCEKARWALDYKQLPHLRRNLPAGLHTAVLQLSRRGPTVPVLEIDGRTIRGSDNIISSLEELWPEPPLYPQGAKARQLVHEIQAEFDRLGHDVRRVMVDPVLRQPELVLTTKIFGHRSSERWANRIGFQAVRPAARWRYGIFPERVEQARRNVGRAFHDLEARLEPSSFLVGKTFSAADLSVAALLAPIVMPPEYPDPPYRVGSAPPDLVALRDSLMNTAGFQWVLDIYERYRAPT